MANILAYGFVGLENLFVDRVDDSNVAVVRQAIQLSVVEHNRQVEAALAELVVPTTAYSTRFKMPGAGTLQPLDEYGNPLPVREGGFYDVAFPIQGGGTAWGDNRVTRALLTVEEVNEMVLGSLKRDSDWMRRHILAALLDDTSWTFPDPDFGDLTIEPLANGGAGVLYNRNDGSVSTDDHYAAQSAGIADATNPYGTLHTELLEHPGNVGSPIVAYIASDLVSDTEGLAGFVAVSDPDINDGADQDTLGNSIAVGMGQELLGKTNKVWIVEWTSMPDGYILGVAKGAASKALRMREYPVAALQGFFTEENSPDGNLEEHRFIRYAGFGGYNRVAAAVVQIGNATYQIPTGFETPLAV